MPVKQPKKKTKRREAVTHSLDLLNSRALLALGNYLEYKVDSKAHASMEQLFRDYKLYKEEVYEALVGAFKFIRKEQFIPDPDDPPGTKLPKGPPPSKEVVSAAKKYINQIAKKVWKK